MGFREVSSYRKAQRYISSVNLCLNSAMHMSDRCSLQLMQQQHSTDCRWLQRITPIYQPLVQPNAQPNPRIQLILVNNRVARRALMSTLFHRHRRPVGFVRRSINSKSGSPGTSRRLAEITGWRPVARLTSICLRRPLATAAFAAFLSFFRCCRHSDDGLTATTAE